MEACTTTLTEDPTALKIEVLALREKVSLLEEHIRQLIHKRFGTSSEKCAPDQINLFNEAEQDGPEDEVKQDETTLTVPTHTRKKPGRKPLPDYLPRVRKEHDLPDAEKVCNGCGNAHLHRIGEDISEQLEIIPAKVQVIQHVRPKYACRACEGTVKTGSIDSPGLLAYIVTSKYVDGLPL